MVSQDKKRSSEDTHKDFYQEERSPLVIDKRVLLISFKSKIKWIALLTFLFMLLVAVIVSIKVKPAWRANCRIIRMQKNIATPSDMPYLYNSFDINTILETARSRPIVLSVMEKLNMKGYEPEEVGRMIEVKRGSRSNVLSFSVTHTDPHLAKEMANVLGNTFIEISTTMQNAGADSVFTYYSIEKARHLSKIAELEEHILKFQKDHDVISIKSERDQLYEKLKLVEIRRIETLITIDAMETKIADVKKKLADLPKEVLMTWQYKNIDENRLAHLEKELASLLTKYTAENPKVLKLTAEVNSLKAKIADPDRIPDPPDNTNWGVNGLIQIYQVDKTRFEGELKAARVNYVAYEDEISKIKNNLLKFNYIDNDYLEYERQLELNKDILRIIEGRIAESKMAIETNRNDFQLFEPATMPRYPVNVSKKLLVLVSGIVAGFLLVVFFVGRELFDFRVKSKQDYEAYIDIPLLGEVPSEEGADPNKFYANFQYMLNNLFDAVQGTAKPAIITIGSVHPQTGKSYVLNEFSRLLASTSKMLIIECIENVDIEMEDYKINSFLDSDTNFQIMNVAANIDKCYFHTGEHIFKKMYNSTDFHKLYSLLMDYDFIFWELFPSKYSIQLYQVIAKSADANVLVGKFRYSPKIDIYNLVSYLKEKDVIKVYGILNNIPKEYYVDTL